MKKIAIITGVTSFLGSSTAEYLIKKGFLVFGIVRPDSQNKEKIKCISGLVIIELDIDKISNLDFAELKNKLSNEDTDNFTNHDITFIHFGWGATLDRANFNAQMLNVDYSLKALEIAKILKADRFIFAGSQAEMSESAYGMAKKQFANISMKLVKDSKMDFIHFRIFSMYGEKDRDTSLIKELVRCLRSNVDIKLSLCDYLWNFLYIDDFTKIIYKFITKKVKTGTYDIASDDTRLLKDYCAEAKKVFKSKSNLLFGEREKSKEKFAIPNINTTLQVIGKFRFTKFRSGILKV